MTDKELWYYMETLAGEKPGMEREMSFMLLLKKAYDQDLKLLMACQHDPVTPGLARQGYMDVAGRRMMVCYTSEQRARSSSYNMTWDIAGARDIMNNMFNKQAIMGMVFNSNDEKMIIIFKEPLLSIMPGEKPRPKFYRE